MRHRGNPDPRQCLDVTAATVGAYSSRASEVQISDGGHSITAYSPIHAGSPCGPSYPVGWFHNRVGAEEFGAVIDCEGQRVLAPEAVSEQSEGK